MHWPPQEVDVPRQLCDGVQLASTGGAPDSTAPVPESKDAPESSGAPPESVDVAPAAPPSPRGVNVSKLMVHAAAIAAVTHTERATPARRPARLIRLVWLRTPRLAPRPRGRRAAGGP